MPFCSVRLQGRTIPPPLPTAMSAVNPAIVAPVSNAPLPVSERPGIFRTRRYASEGLGNST